MSKQKVKLVGMPLSGLIRIAVRDARRAARSSWYVLRMGSWHKPVQMRSGRKCAVCMAGAVMAYSLGARRALPLFPEDMTRNSGPLRAINCAREGLLMTALDVLGVNVSAIDRMAVTSASQIIRADFNNETGRAPWRTYLQAAKRLEKAGL